MELRVGDGQEADDGSYRDHMRSYWDKKGSQTLFEDNTLELVVGTKFFARKKMFDRVVEFAKFSEFPVAASVS